MKLHRAIVRFVLIGVAAAMVLAAQQPQQAPPAPLPRPSNAPRLPATMIQTQAPPAAKPEPAKPEAAKPEEAKPEGAKPEVQAPAAPQAEAPKPAEGAIGGLNLQNVSLVEVLDFLARELKINYILDPRVQGSVTLNTYGPVRDLDRRELLDTILRINGAAMVQTGGIYRVVPLAELASMPLTPQQDLKNIPEDDRAMLNLIFLKYANAEELAKLLGEFVGKDAKVWSYPPANLLLVLDSRRSMRRTMELITLFDSDSLARQRVRLFETKFGRPTDLAKELENLMQSISMGKDLQSIRFVPVDRINLLIAVAPNPGVFGEVETWLKKLDVKVASAAGRTDTYVYRVKFGQAQFLSQSIMMLYYSMYPGFGMGGMYGGMGGMGGFGGMYGGMGGMGGMYGGMGGMYGGMGYGSPYGALGTPMAGGAAQGGAVAQGARTQGGVATQGTGVAGTMGAGGGFGNMTGQFLGAGMMGGYGMPAGPRVVPNMMDNSLLILATGEEYESILKLLRELDIPPRQVLIEAKIYEVTLGGAFSNGVAAYLRRRGTSTEGGPPADFDRMLQGSIASGAISLSAGMLIGQSRELLGFLESSETRTRTRIISAPSIIATDSIPASINVGLEVPTLQSQAVTGVQQGGDSLFANTISNRKTGVNLSITARVNPSGVVTMEINQEISSPQAPEAGSSIQSPSFSQRTISTQVTVQDGDLVAIGGIINETNGDSSVGVPLFHKIPYLGAAFGSKASNRSRTELVVFLTPRVIYDTNDVVEASDELTGGLRRLHKLMRKTEY